MSELRRLRLGDGPAVLAFETANRRWFAATISDRGDAYFAHFGERHREMVTDQEAGAGAYYLLLSGVGDEGEADDDGGPEVWGRFNLVLVGDGVAHLGYRVAEHVAGRGVATAAVLDLCALAASRHEVTTVRAAVAHTNPASQRVLLKAGFHPVGPADPSDLGGKRGTWYERAAGR